MLPLPRQSTMKIWLAAIIVSLVLTAWGAEAFALTKKDLRRINDEGPVEITIIYQNPLQQKESQELSFEVRMETHSADLDGYDMKKISFLRFDDGPEINTLGWFEPGGGGHHVFGILKFKGPIPAEAKSLKIIIRTVGEVAERIFEWKLPLR